MSRLDAVLGLDIGTTSIKACVVDTSSKSVLATASAVHEANLTSDGSRQDARRILKAVEKCVLSLASDATTAVSRLAICGQMHGLVLWTGNSIAGAQSADDVTTSDLYTWQSREPSADFIAEIGGDPQRVFAGFGTATLAWLHANNSKVSAEFDCAGSAADLVVAYLTRSPLAVPMSTQMAESWGFFDAANNRWSISPKHVPFHLLPPIVEPGSLVGCLQRELGELPLGALVTVALGDLQATAAPFLDDQSVVLNLGTSAQLWWSESSKLTKGSGENCVTFDSDHRLRVYASLNGGNQIDQWLELIQSWCRDAATTSIDRLEFDKQAILTRVDEKAELQAKFRLTDQPSPLRLQISRPFIPERGVVDASTSKLGLVLDGLEPSTSLDSLLLAASHSVVDNMFRMSVLNDTAAAADAAVASERGTIRGRTKVVLAGASSSPRFRYRVEELLREHFRQANVEIPACSTAAFGVSVFAIDH